MLTLASIEKIVGGHGPRGISSEVAPKRAAVAVVLREGPLGTEILMMQRAERDGDRWSGQVSFPGGREEDRDDSLLTTAIRETHEEVAIDLAREARHVGQLDAIQARSRSGPAGLSVWPFVFVARRELVPQRSVEAEAVFWLPLPLVVSGELDAIYPYQIGRGKIDLPCWHFEGHTVWGMTHRMLSDFIELLSSADPS